MKKIFILVFAVIASITVTLFLILGKSNELTALLESPIANMQLSTAKEIRRHVQDKGSTLGKPVYAQVIVEYEPINDHTKEDVYNEISKIMDENGWEKEATSIKQPGYSRFLFPKDRFTLLAEVVKHSNENSVNVNLGTIPN